ncbi:glycosyl transferase family 2 [Halorubrum salipaludis]|uniref:Glycosyl transferase family 2 n=1 Tax=Halorubrum salipaludis TaxID=2032630 RepID=A0A2A2FK27_9EURY|nr:glycosyl transferase family 2 [Halorubrum salipaludis]
MTIIIPHYNEPDLLLDALESVSSQKYENIECIVVDDCSEQPPEFVLDKFTEVTLVQHQANRGAAAARNTGLTHAQGNYIAFLDVDDVWDNEKIERQVEKFLSADQDVGLVYTGFKQILTDGSRINHAPKYRGEIYQKELEKDRIHPTSTVMVRAKVLNNVGGFDEDLPARQDYELWIRITEKYSVDYVDEILVTKKEHEQNISSNFESRITGDKRVFNLVKQHVAKHKFGALSRIRIYSYHYYLIGRDYDQFGRRHQALRYLLKSLLVYPFRLEPWLFFIVALTGIDRESRVFRYLKQVFHS